MYFITILRKNGGLLLLLLLLQVSKRKSFSRDRAVLSWNLQTLQQCLKSLWKLQVHIYKSVGFVRERAMIM